MHDVLYVVKIAVHYLAGTPIGTERIPAEDDRTFCDVSLFFDVDMAYTFMHRRMTYFNNRFGGPEHVYISGDVERFWKDDIEAHEQEMRWEIEENETDGGDYA
tara:strand:- start:283 stop:591 length:309 start_codon:yes stop_codon:yes gene_type:complete